MSSARRHGLVGWLPPAFLGFSLLIGACDGGEQAGDVDSATTAIPADTEEAFSDPRLDDPTSESPRCCP